MDVFQMNLKPAEISHIFQKSNDVDKENCRPVSVLFNVSEVFKRIIDSQIDEFMRDKLSNLLTGFRKNHST